MRRTRRAAPVGASLLLVQVALLAAAACDDRRVVVGHVGPARDAGGQDDGATDATGDGARSERWHAGFEPGDFSEWDQAYQGNVGAIAISQEHARTGRHALRITLGADLSGAQSTALVVRERLPMPAARYRAWYFFPAAPVIEGYLSLFKFRAEDASGQMVDLLAVGVRGTPPEPRVAYLAASREILAPGLSLPVGRWFPIEVALRFESNDLGRFEVDWDGRRLGEAQGPVLRPRARPIWQLGAVTTRTGPVTFFIDDAEIEVD